MSAISNTDLDNLRARLDGAEETIRRLTEERDAVLCNTCGKLPPHEGCTALCAACAAPTGACTCAACNLVNGITRERDKYYRSAAEWESLAMRVESERDEAIAARDRLRADVGMGVQINSDLRAEVGRLRQKYHDVADHESVTHMAEELTRLHAMYEPEEVPPETLGGEPIATSKPGETLMRENDRLRAAATDLRAEARGWRERAELALRDLAVDDDASRAKADRLIAIITERDTLRAEVDRLRAIEEAAKGWLDYCREIGRAIGCNSVDVAMLDAIGRGEKPGKVGG